MHREYILLNGFRKAKKVFTAGFHVPLKICLIFAFTLNWVFQSIARTIHTRSKTLSSRTFKDF